MRFQIRRGIGNETHTTFIAQRVKWASERMERGLISTLAALCTTYKRGRFRRSGQALTELALIVPMMVMMLAGVFEFGRALYTYTTIVHATREGARVAIVTADDASIRHAVQQAADVSIPDANITIIRGSGAPAQTSVSVVYDFQANIPLISRFFDHGVLRLHRTIISRFEG